MNLYDAAGNVVGCRACPVCHVALDDRCLCTGLMQESVLAQVVDRLIAAGKSDTEIQHAVKVMKEIMK